MHGVPTVAKRFRYLVMLLISAVVINALVVAPSDAAHSPSVLIKKKTGRSAVRHRAYRVHHKPAPRLYLASPTQAVGDEPPHLSSAKALVIHQQTGKTFYAKNIDQQTPIASVTKLMTAMVVLDAKQPMDDWLYVTSDDEDHIKGTHSRLKIGTALTRGEFMRLALIASENRAATTLGRHYPGGISAFVQAMNNKAASLGMTSTHFVEPSGLDRANVSTAEDLAKMVNAAYNYSEIREVTTIAQHDVMLEDASRPLQFINTNALVRAGDWGIGLSKTGFIKEAGRCLVMQAQISGQPFIIVLLDSVGKLSRIGDANRIRKWLETRLLHSDKPILASNVVG